MMEQNPYVAIEQLRQDAERIKRAQTNSLLPAGGRVAGAVPTVDNTGAVAWSAPVPWTTPTYQSGWSDYGSGFGPFKFCRSADGLVVMQGIVKRNTTDNSLIFYLPAGCRPGFTVAMHLVGAFTTTGATEVTRPVYIYADGRVRCEAAPAGGAGSVTYQSLSCSFMAEQ